ncbi:MAG: hypothetical protein WBP45_14685 [Daejeonella sp.]
MSIYVNGNLAVLPGSGQGVLVTMGGNVGLPKKVNRNPIVKDKKVSKGLASWGPENNFPQIIIELLATNPIIARTLDDKVCMAQGKDVVPIFYKWDEDGKKKIQYINDPEIWDFLELYSTENYINEALTYLFTFYNVFPKLTRSINGKKILRIDAEDTSFCRFCEQDANGICREVYVNANWPKAKISDEETITYPSIDTSAFNLVAEVENLNEDEFIFPVSYATPGKTFYQLAHWDAFRQSDWNEVLNMIPKYKKWQMENGCNVQYHLEVPDYYFEAKYGKAYSDVKDKPEGLAIRKQELQNWNDFLSAPENAGKSIASIFKVINHKDKVPGVSITPIENKTKDGTLLKDNQEAFSLLLYSLGMDPTLLGFNPGDKSSHSGTDKREAFILFLSKIEPYRKKILAPLNFIAKYNGWTKKYPRMKFVFEDTILTSLDSGASTDSVLNTGKA